MSGQFSVISGQLVKNTTWQCGQRQVYVDGMWLQLNVFLTWFLAQLSGLKLPSCLSSNLAHFTRQLHQVTVCAE